MIALNFTLVVQLGLFLLFLWGTNRFVFRPLLRTMDARNDKLEQDRVHAETDAQEAKRLETLYTDRLTTAHQVAAQRLNKARYDAYQENRAALEAAKRREEAEVGAYRDALDQQVGGERAKFAALLPGIIEAMDRQVNTEGSLL